MPVIGWKGVIATAAVGWLVVKGMDNYYEKNEQAIKDGLDPTSDQNIFYRAFTHVYKAITDSKQDLGGDIYDWLHPKEKEAAHKDQQEMVKESTNEQFSYNDLYPTDSWGGGF